jgi:hypothetical protein
MTKFDEREHDTQNVFLSTEMNSFVTTTREQKTTNMQAKRNSALTCVERCRASASGKVFLLASLHQSEETRGGSSI